MGPFAKAVVVLLAGATALWVTVSQATSAANRSEFLPGRRVLLDAHNAYPDQGRWKDRLVRALGTGTPLGVEQDLVWQAPVGDRPGRSVVSHGEPLSGDEPTLADFFETIRPIVERTLASGTSEDWPIVTLNLDFKDSEPEHFAAIRELLGKYAAWLTSAERAEDSTHLERLEVAPVLVLTGDDPVQERAFHDAVPVGGRLRLFGGYHPPRPESSDTGDVAGQSPQIDFRKPIMEFAPPIATNYRRWSNNPWAVVEPEGQPDAGSWTETEARRLRTLVEVAHARGLWIRFYALNGHAPAEDELFGWSAGYNFGSLAAARERWRAAIRAGVDFVATDQYEEFVSTLRSERQSLNSPARGVE
jgi:hypothetical protein